MKKRCFIAALSAVTILFTLSAETMAYAVNLYDVKPDDSYWDKFIKYDLCITDYDSLTEEEKELCHYIFETERSTQYICLRARKILAHDENIGERITVDKIKSSYGIWDNYDNNQYKQGFEYYTHCVPDLFSSYIADEHIYWLDNAGESYVKYEGFKETATVCENGEEKIIDLQVLPYFDEPALIETGEYENENYINVDGLYFYIFPDGEAKLITTKYKKYEWDSEAEPITEPIIIPETVQGHTVTTICSSAFWNSAISEVVLPDTIETIGCDAFNNCNYLEEINFPNSLKIIGDEAFYKCNLKSLDLNFPDLVIPYRAFASNKNLTDVNLNVHEISQEAFYSCENIENINFGNDLYKIGVGSFYNSSKLENIQLPSSLRIIGVEAFATTKSVTIPKSVEIIGSLPYKLSYSGGFGLIIFPLTHTYECAFDPNGTINGWYGTEAHSYALSNNLKFNSMDELLYGDANNDGEIGIADAVSLQKYLLRNETVGYEADLNKDGRIDSFDMIAMRKMLIKN